MHSPTKDVLQFDEEPVGHRVRRRDGNAVPAPDDPRKPRGSGAADVGAAHSISGRFSQAPLRNGCPPGARHKEIPCFRHGPPGHSADGTGVRDELGEGCWCVPSLAALAARRRRSSTGWALRTIPPCRLTALRRVSVDRVRAVRGVRAAVPLRRRAMASVTGRRERSALERARRQAVVPCVRHWFAEFADKR
jgi:hypothetical protein